MRYERKQVVIQFLNNDYEGTYRAVNFLLSGKDQEAWNLICDVSRQGMILDDAVKPRKLCEKTTFDKF